MEQKDELDILHSGLMALEDLLIQKGIISTDELNPLIKKYHKECVENRLVGKEPKVFE